MEVTDRRVRKTRVQLKAALSALMREKDVKEITVRELTERADLNRGTFYCHYKDIYDMVEQVQGEVLEELNAVLNAYTPQQLQQGLRPILGDVFALVDRNADLFAALLGGGDSNPAIQLNQIIQDKVLKDWWEVYGAGMGESQYYLDFVVAGTIGILNRWLLAGRRETPEEMAALTERAILNGGQQAVGENTK